MLCKPALMEGWGSYFGYGLKGRNTSATAAIPAGYANHAMVSLTAEWKEQTPSSNSRHPFFPSLTSPGAPCGKKCGVTQPGEQHLPCHAPLLRQDRLLDYKASCKTSIIPALLATCKENTGPRDTHVAGTGNGAQHLDSFMEAL